MSSSLSAKHTLRLWAGITIGLAVVACVSLYALRKNSGPGSASIEAPKKSSPIASSAVLPKDHEAPAPETPTTAAPIEESISSHTEIKKQYEAMEDQEIVDELQEIDAKIANDQLIEKANAAPLDREQSLQLKGLLRKKVALMGIQTERLLSQK